MVRKMTLLVGLASALLAAANVRAQNDIIADQFYGSGVHRYFAGDVFSAHADFTNAIQNGGEDPRPYYFRGLAYLRMGRPYEASADFRKGADLESNDINGSFQVSKSLERIQGQQRLQLERYRVQARAIAQQRQDKQRRERYAASRRFEAEQIQRAAATQDNAAAARAPQPPARDPFDEAAEPAPLPGGQATPFAGSPPADPRPAARDAAQPAAMANPPEAEAVLADPFAAPAGAEKTTVDKTTIIEEKTAPAEKPAGAAADPFGTPATPARGTPRATPADASDPFGAPTAPSAPGTPAPATPTDTNDPFGAPAASPTSGAREPAPSTDSSDPFGGGAPSPPATGGNAADPFGGSPAASTPDSANGASKGTTDGSARPARPVAPGNNAPQTSGSTGGFFRALGRAVGLDAAHGAAESAMQALPIGRGSASQTMPAGGGARGNAPVITRQLGAGANPTQMAPAQDTNPFGAPAAAPSPAADPDDPFGPADNSAAPATPAGPFGAPAAGAPAATGDDPFKDDAVQPAAPAAPPADPFGGR